MFLVCFSRACSPLRKETHLLLLSLFVLILRSLLDYGTAVATFRSVVVEYFFIRCLIWHDGLVLRA